MRSEQLLGGPSGEAWPEGSNTPSSSECVSCARERALSTLKEHDIRRWRIESTKQQILERLDMQERPPRVKTKDQVQQHKRRDLSAVLPDSVMATLELEQQQQQQQEAGVRQLILFPAKTLRTTKNAVNYRSHRVEGRLESTKFHVTDEMMEFSLQSAVFWTPVPYDDDSISSLPNNSTGWF